MQRTEIKSLDIVLQSVPEADGNLSRCSAGSFVVTASSINSDWTQPAF